MEVGRFDAGDEARVADRVHPHRGPDRAATEAQLRGPDAGDGEALAALVEDAGGVLRRARGERGLARGGVGGGSTCGEMLSWEVAAVEWELWLGERCDISHVRPGSE